MKAVDISGQRFGRLTAVRRAGTAAGFKTVWEFRCDCGGTVLVRKSDVTGGKTRSCGCLRVESARATAKKNTVHGATGSRLYMIWQGMRARCRSDHKDYGGRGIEVCDEWKDNFEAFREWALSHGYMDTLTIDRKDSNGPYSPQNCRWATMREQQNNRRNNRLISYNGKTQTLAQWARDTGIAPQTIAQRIKAGWPENEIFIEANLNNSRIRKEMKKDA